MGKDCSSLTSNTFKILASKRANVSKIGKEKDYTASVVTRCLSIPLNF